MVRIPLDDALDVAGVAARLVPEMARGRGRAVAFAQVDPSRAVLVRRWASEEGHPADEALIEIEVHRLHPLLPDDTQGHRPFRPLDKVAPWVLADLLPGASRERTQVRARSVAVDGQWLGVLVVALPRGLLASRADDEELEAAARSFELAVARAHLRAELRRRDQEHRQAVDALTRRLSERVRELETELERARRDAEAARPRLDALERAAERATELLMDAHERLAERTDRLRRHTRVAYLLRQLLERYAEGSDPRTLASDLVRLVAEAFGGGRCSLLLVDPERPAEYLRMAAALGLPPSVDPRRVRVPVGQGIAGRVVRERTPVVVRDAAEAGAYPLVADEAYTTPAFVSLPLACHGQVHGVLNVTNFRTGTLDETDLEQLRLVALCIALVVDHARLSERLFALENAEA